ncbi:MAG: DUF1801 domain-containing protein [Fulvivirga sp.]|nr:DUF1801 domain-containing protein [Fulvivirga sp.]
MNKFQNVNFRSVNDFIDYLPENELQIVEVLRKLIFESIPEIEEKLAYNVPFYSRYYRICYIWPASVPWGGVKKGVSIGFVRANEMALEDQYLSFGNKKHVGTKNYTSVKEIDIEKLSMLLYEACEVDELKAKGL